MTAFSRKYCCFNKEKRTIIKQQIQKRPEFSSYIHYSSITQSRLCYELVRNFSNNPIMQSICFGEVPQYILQRMLINNLPGEN